MPGTFILYGISTHAPAREHVDRLTTSKGLDLADYEPLGDEDMPHGGLAMAVCQGGTHLRPLACISHHVATVARDMPQSAAFSRFGVLDVLLSTTPRPSGRKRHISRHLAGLATRRGEKCRLG